MFAKALFMEGIGQHKMINYQYMNEECVLNSGEVNVRKQHAFLL